jgi:group I intron endonuclease
MVSGVYQIIHKISKKSYIGSACAISRRWLEHKYDLSHNKSSSILFQRAYNKYGIENFEFKILEECSKEKLLEREQYYLDLYKSYLPENGYNICKVAGYGSQLGLKRSSLSKQLMSLAKKGKPGNSKTIEAMRLVNIGNQYTKGKTFIKVPREIRVCNCGCKSTFVVLSTSVKQFQKYHYKKLRETRTCLCGCNQTFEVIVTSLKQYVNGGHALHGKIGPNLGRKFSDAVKQKFSLSHLGKTQSQEIKKKRSLAMTGKNLRNKNGVGNKGSLGRIPWNKGLTKETDSRIKGPNK